MAPVRERDAGGHGGGFAALGALLRRVGGVSRLYWCNSPRLVAVRSRFGAVRSRFGAVRSWFGVVRSRFGVVWRPKCRPPRRQTPTMGCRGRGGLRCGQNCLGHGVLFAREPASACANRLFACKGVGGVGVGRGAGGGVGGVPVLPPVGPSCAWRGAAVSGSVCQFRVCSCMLGHCTRSVGNAPLLFGCSAT